MYHIVCTPGIYPILQEETEYSNLDTCLYPRDILVSRILNEAGPASRPVLLQPIFKRTSAATLSSYDQLYSCLALGSILSFLTKYRRPLLLESKSTLSSPAVKTSLPIRHSPHVLAFPPQRSPAPQI